MHNGCDKCCPSDGKEVNLEHLEQIASRKGMTFDDTLYICLECQGNWFYQRWEEERNDGSEWGDIYEQLITISENEIRPTDFEVSITSDPTGWNVDSIKDTASEGEITLKNSTIYEPPAEIYETFRISESDYFS